MFIRTKKVNNNVYAYFVKNKWVDGRTSQTTVKYLGRVFPFKKTKSVDFIKFSKLEGKKTTNRELLQCLVEWELYKHGFNKVENVWKKDNIVANPKVFSFTNKKKEIALSFNDGFLSKPTIQRLVKFTVSSEEDGYKYAKYFIEAGIDVPEPVFVHMFKNVKRK